MGRRSLLWSLRADEHSNIDLTLSSVACSICSCESHANVSSFPTSNRLVSCYHLFIDRVLQGMDFLEFPADGLYSIDCSDTKHGSKLFVEWHPWIRGESPCGIIDCQLISVIQRRALSSPMVLNCSEEQLRTENVADLSIDNVFSTFLNDPWFELHIEGFRKVLSDAVAKRTRHRRPVCKECYLLQKPVLCSHSSLAMLFSGGIDSAVIAALADRYVVLVRSIDQTHIRWKSF